MTIIVLYIVLCYIYIMSYINSMDGTQKKVNKIVEVHANLNII